MKKAAFLYGILTLTAIGILAGGTTALGNTISITYSYDDAGRLIQANYGAGNNIFYAYDANGNLLSRQVGADATGLLTVTIEPAGARAAGAQWRLQGGEWQSSGASEYLPEGSYTIEFKEVAGWPTPANRTVAVGEGRTFITGRYITERVKAEHIFDEIERLYPKLFYPSGQPVEIYEGYKYTMYYRYYSANDLTLLTYEGAVYYKYIGEYHSWNTVEEWLTYLDYCGVSVMPVTSDTVSFGDLIDAANNISWLRLWTGHETGGSYVNTSSYNAYGNGWIAVKDLHYLRMDFAQYANTILYVLPWGDHTACAWKKYDVDFQASNLVRDSVNLGLYQGVAISEVLTVENTQKGRHWLQIWVGDYIDTSTLNIYGNGWVEVNDLPNLMIPEDTFKTGTSLWVRQYSQFQDSSNWVDYGWLELK